MCDVQSFLDLGSVLHFLNHFTYEFLDGSLNLVFVCDIDNFIISAVNMEKSFNVAISFLNCRYDVASWVLDFALFMCFRNICSSEHFIMLHLNVLPLDDRGRVNYFLFCVRFFSTWGLGHLSPEYRFLLFLCFRPVLVRKRE